MKNYFHGENKEQYKTLGSNCLLSKDSRRKGRTGRTVSLRYCTASFAGKCKNLLLVKSNVQMCSFQLVAGRLVIVKT